MTYPRRTTLSTAQLADLTPAELDKVERLIAALQARQQPPDTQSATLDPASARPCAGACRPAAEPPARP